MSSKREKTVLDKENIISRVASYFVGARSKVMYISSNDETIISFPWLFAVLFLLVFDVPSWIIALLLICLIVFNLDLNVASQSKRDAFSEATVTADDYNREKKQNHYNITTDSEGFSEMVIN